MTADQELWKKNWSGASAGPNKYEEGNGTGLDNGYTIERNDEASPNRRYSGNHRATEEEVDQGIL